MKEFPIKFRSLRDKNASHRRSKSVPAGSKDSKSRPLSAETFRAIFKMDGSKQNAKADTEKELEESKIEDVQRLLDELDVTGVSTEHIRDILTTSFANGDAARTADFIDIETKAQAGVIVPYDPDVRMLGAENRSSVTCYLDALLFAMFSKLDAFECMLKNEFPHDDPRDRLVTLLRIWVNMLRTGKLIHADLTKLIQDALGDCGWPDARLLEQQDTSEAFAFLTETLQLPLLSLQVDLFHQGKRDKDDHKVVYERLLNLAVPADPDCKGVKLEDCLEEYFNARVDVLRVSEEGKKAGELDEVAADRTPKSLSQSSRHVGQEEKGESSASVTTLPLVSSPSSVEVDDPFERNGSCNETQTTSTSASDHDSHQDTTAVPKRMSLRHRSTSVIRRVMVDEKGRPTGDSSRPGTAGRHGSSVVKAVTIPAWQFFRLIPWHALSSSEPRNDVEVAMNFDKKPVVGICLKRYAMTDSGQPKRLNTFIDIPDSLRLPHFMLAESPELEEENGLSAEYKLELQSVVCHRGDSLQSGHYIAFARIAPKLLTDNRRHDFDPPPDYEEAQWVHFDDLNAESRVVFVDDIKQSLKDEMPYLLFYQVVPIVDMTCPSTEGTETEPPSYNESKTSFDLASSGSLCDGEFRGSLEPPGHHPHDKLPVDTLGRSKPPSIRLSAEADRSLPITSDRSWMASTPGDSRRQSVAFTESGGVTPAITPDAHSPIISPSDEVSSSRLSRAASRFALGKQSRPVSQTGEGRLSFSMTRLSGLMKSSKEPLVEANGLATPVTNAPVTSHSDVPTKTSESPEDGEKTPGPPKQRGGKPKNKTMKQKSDTVQPERECLIM
ncbi:hypothetical protein CDD82_2694 [Ophiocordyceps australis]|uniref:ubiquitinyl hydrolase 1 n=1 Tax=Ophiocordyceps australis TaxID=1399860 RepID=A0A2C5ZAZ8_9HYPO|nr:hypothetical protein CDD82_2694 [Ophiocordyceps australis]